MSTNFNFLNIFFVFLFFAISLFIQFEFNYLGSWDERFHALVAKNIMSAPLKPMLIKTPLWDYDYTAWCCNHVWLHKQPLFMWQMAASMKLFGTNVIVMRLPSIIMSLLAAFLIFDIARILFKSNLTASLAFTISLFSYYQFGLTAGFIPLDQNDICFFFYITASFWAFTKWTNDNCNLKWSILIGVFAGAAVLTKWLTGIIVFAAIGFYILLTFRSKLKIKLTGFSISLVICVLIFLPWQIYIFSVFPKEASHEMAYNSKHFFEAVEFHSGSRYFYLNQFKYYFGIVFIPFLFYGIYCSIKNRHILYDKTLASLIFASFIFILFFSIAATKMPSYVYPVASIFIILIADGISRLIQLIKSGLNFKSNWIYAISFFWF